MAKVFIYWHNSNIFVSAQQVAIEREGETARYRTRIHFRNLLELAQAGREIERAVAVGSVPPELRHVWNRLENEGANAQMTNQLLQTSMLRDALDSRENSQTAVVVTDDGDGGDGEMGFLADLERIRRRGWRIEVLSWRHSCNRRMREWAEQNGKFIPLDDFYESVTYLEPPAPGRPIADPRDAVPVDLSQRP